MAKVIDLSTIVKEDLVFKLVDGKEVVIPGQVNTYFVLQFTKLQQDLEENQQDQDKVLDILLDMVTLILQQDEKAGITRDYVNKNLADVNLMRVIIEEMTKHIHSITEDENLESPQQD